MRSSIYFFLSVMFATQTSFSKTDSLTEILEIEDLTNLPFLSLDLKQRSTEKISLPNGLQILLISDPQADQSAASVSVGSGSWCDPEEYPGMAHFCEHMLFMGTQKYPDSHEFSTHVAHFKGQTNAFTAPHQTVYMFSAHEAGFLPLLDRFAHFFIDPLFDPENLAQELYAVDQEFALQKENDGWRKYFVFKETGNPHHPYASFVTGNSSTLSRIPQQALQKWHEKHYIASNMRVAIYSALPMDVLKKEAALSFKEIPKGISSNQNLVFTEPMSSSRQKGHITFLEPILNQSIIELSWEFPHSWAQDPSHTLDLIAYALEEGREKNLLQKLLKESLIDDLNISTSTTGTTHPFLSITLALSDIGMQKMEETIAYVFQAIAGLKEKIPEYLFDEKNTLASLNYQYQPRMNAFRFISRIGRTLLQEDLATYPRQLVLANEYSFSKVEEALQFLTPKDCMISCSAPQKVTHAVYDAKEKWLQTPYTVQPIPEKWLTAWSQVSPHPDLTIPSPNTFIPHSLAIIPDPNLGNVPVCIAESDFGSAYYVRCPEYQTPNSAIHLRIFSAAFEGSVKDTVLGDLYLDHLSSSLCSLLHAADSAQMRTELAIEPHYMHLAFSGFSEKMPLLLQEVLSLMTTEAPSPEQFLLAKERLQKSYANKAKAMPVRQGQELLSTLIHPEKMTSEQKLGALASIRFEDVVLFSKKIFEKTYCQALFAGNLALKTVEASWLDILHSLGTSPYPQQEHPILQTLRLSEGAGPLLIAKETESQGTSTILLIDQGDYSLEKRGAQNILAAALQEPFFDALRTKQKTGYIAQSSHLESEKRLYQTFFVQSNTHDAEDLLYRFEFFLEDFCAHFTDLIGKERFETIRQSVINTLKTQCRNIKDKADLWNTLSFDEKGDFSLQEKRIKALQNLSYETFTELSLNWLAKSNTKRLAILYHGKLENPFTYSSIQITDFAQSAIYGMRPTQFEETQ